MDLPKVDDVAQCWRDFGIRSRLSFALQQDGFQKDVTFIVGQSAVIISAHRLILSLSSTYFDKLIRDGGGGLINLPAVDPAMFKRLLKFIYTDELEHETFLPFLEFAKTFGFHHLDKMCLDSWQKEGITVENVVFILTLEGRQNRGGGGEGMDSESELRRNCLQFINKNADHVVRLNSFNEISQQDLGVILDSDHFVLEGGEFSVYLVALRWAKYQTKAGGGVADTPGNLKLVLGDVRFKIRYTLIPYPQLLSEVKLSRLLTPPEFLQVLKTFIDPTENTLGISTTPRNDGSPLLLSQGIPNMNETENSDYTEPKRKRLRVLSQTETNLVHNLVHNNLSPVPAPGPVPAPCSQSQTAPLPPSGNSLATLSDQILSNNHDSLTRAPYLKIVTPNAEQLILQRKLPTAPPPPSLTTSATNGEEVHVQDPVAIANPQNSFSSQDERLGTLHPVPSVPESESLETLPTAVVQLLPLGNSSPNTSDGAQEPEVVTNRCASSSIIVPDSSAVSFPIPKHNSYSSTDYVISNTYIDWGQLISRIECVQSTLSSIVLNNMALVDFKPGNRVVLPQLELFHYSLDRDNLPTNANPALPDKSHPYFVNMKGFLFFEKSSRTQYRFETLSSLGVDIRVSIKGIKLMDICPSEKKILLSYPPTAEGDAILENCPTSTKMLCLCCAGIKSPERIPTNSLEQLILYNVEINGMTTTRFVNQCPALKQLSLFEFYDNPEQLSPLYLSTCLRKCRASLKSLSLSKFSVAGPSLNLSFVPFSAMESLYLNCCGWNSRFHRHMGKTFPNLKRFGIRWAWKDKAKVCALLKDVINQLRRLEVLVISLRNSIDFEEGDGDIFNMNPTEEEEWIQIFLTDATPAPPEIIGTGTDVEVVEDLLSQDIVLKKVAGVWKRAGTGNHDAAAVDSMHYQALKLNLFFDDVRMTKYLS